MNDDLRENELAEGEWVEPDAVEFPQPSKYQNLLWDYLDAIFDEGALNREMKFVQLDSKTRDWLASITLSSAIGKLGKKYVLTYDETTRLARLIRYFFIEEIARDNLASALEATIKIDLQKAAAISADPDFKNLLRLEEAPPPPEIKATPQIPEAPPVEVTPKPTQAALGDEPFLLHEEKPLFTPSGPKEMPSVSFEPKRRWPTPPPKPVAAKIETPNTEDEENKKRVVHYSNLRTPLDTNDR